jgi:hypothetical protein
MPSLWLSAATALACVLFVTQADAASNADYTSAAADKYGSVAIQSQGFVAYGDLDTPAVVNLALSAGHYRLNDIFTVCEVGKHAVVSDDPNDPRTVNACNGAEFFLRISPGMEPHIALTLLKDESSLHSFRGSNLAADIDYSTWPSTNGHGVTKMCGDWTLDECYVNRAMTYTTSWKDVRQPENPGPIVIRGSHESPSTVTVPRNTSSSLNNNVTSSVLSSHHGTPPIATAAAPVLPAELPSSSPYRVDVLKRLPPGVNFESRMAGSFYRLHLNAMHFLIEVDVPEDLAGHAFVQLEVRLTGANSMTVGTRGLLGTMGLLLAIGFGLMGVKKFALARYRTFEVLTPLEVWTFRGRLGRAVENAIVPEARLPEIIGKPVTPTRLAPKPPRQDTAAQTVAASGEKRMPSGVEVCSEERQAGTATEEEVSTGPATATSGPTGAGGWAALVARLRGTLENAPRPRLPALPVPHSGRERLAQHDDADGDANAEELEANHSIVNEHAALTGASTTAAVLDNRDETDDRSAAAAGGASTDAAPTASTVSTSVPASSIRAKASAAAAAAVGFVRAPLPPSTVMVTIPTSSDDEDELLCRICQDATPRNDLFAPCHCAGTSKYVHRECLDRWRYSTSNPHHRDACAECKNPYVRKEDLERAEAAERRRGVPALAKAVRCLIVAGRPIYVLVGAAFLAGYAVKAAALFFTGLDLGVDWLPSWYHCMVGVSVLLSVQMVIVNLSHFFSGLDIWVARACLWALGFGLPILFGYVAQFLVWLAEITLLRPEICYVSGFVCQFVAAQYFLPTLNEYADRATLRHLLRQDFDRHEEVRRRMAEAAQGAAGAAAAEQQGPQAPALNGQGQQRQQQQIADDANGPGSDADDAASDVSVDGSASTGTPRYQGPSTPAATSPSRVGLPAPPSAAAPMSLRATVDPPEAEPTRAPQDGDRSLTPPPPARTLIASVDTSSSAEIGHPSTSQEAASDTPTAT